MYLFCNTSQIIWYSVLSRDANATGLLLHLQESVNFKEALSTMLRSFAKVDDVQVGEVCRATTGKIVH